MESWRRIGTGIPELRLHQLLYCSHVKITAKKSTSSGTFRSPGTSIGLSIEQAGENRGETGFTFSRLFHLGCNRNDINFKCNFFLKSLGFFFINGTELSSKTFSIKVTTLYQGKTWPFRFFLMIFPDLYLPDCAIMSTVPN